MHQTRLGDRVLDLAETGTRDVERWSAEVGAVEHVEELPAELEVDALADGCPLHEAHVEQESVGSEQHGLAERAEGVLELLLSYGVNHLDVAASYGEAEVNLVPWLARHRNYFFLATKTEQRTYQGAKDELHRSLERMRVDSVDHWQMHVLVDEEGWQTAMGPGGALEAFIEAREQGLTRFLGVTGHGLQVTDFHRRSL